MDLDIGSLIYILITVVAIIGGIAGKKKKPTKGVTSEEEGSGTPIEGFFGKLGKQLESFSVEAKGSIEGLKNEFIPDTDATTETETVEVDERDYFEKMSDDYDAIDKNDLKNNFAEYERHYSPEDKQDFELLETEGMSTSDALELFHLDEDSEEIPYDFKDLENFDLRTAIIYSSIINRIEI
jgi:uncharacterized protein (DUF433 family)